MKKWRAKFLQFRLSASPWRDNLPIRSELFGIERLEQHAQTLAQEQPISHRPVRVPSLHLRLDDNAATLLAAYRASARELEKGNTVVPAAEWLLDNYHLVEAQIREIREDLPPSYYRLLPKLAEGPFRGYPRVFGIAWAFIAHTDSHFDPENLRRFIRAYQRVEPLTIGELWAVAITLRIVLIENLRRLADGMAAGRDNRNEAEALANSLLASDRAQAALALANLPRDDTPLNVHFAAQLAKRLRNHDPRTTPSVVWLEERLRQQGSSVEDIVRDAQQRLGASNVTVRNIITSMRLISDIDWATLFESVSLVDECLKGYPLYQEMDFSTRNSYRTEIEQLARGSSASELSIAGLALEMARQAAVEQTSSVEADRVGDPGYFLIDEGRLALERKIAFRPPWHLRISRQFIHPGIRGYAGSIITLTVLGAALMAGGLNEDGQAGWLWSLVFLLLALLPVSEAATALVNRLVTWRLGAAPLPGLALEQGVPPSMRTLLVVPALLNDQQDIASLSETLEIHYLASAPGDVTLALLTDWPDGEEECSAEDQALLDAAVFAVRQLNTRYGLGPAGERFLLLHRHRRFNASESCWMGWERKRGKLDELNRLLRGATDTSFMPLFAIPQNVRFVITLDADTRLPRDTALRLIGKMAHPLNRPRFDDQQRRIVSGYGILQPRITGALPMGREGSLYQRIFSSPSGMDPYAAAVSDVYQDLFGEGSFTGKGIYDVDAFTASQHGRVPENLLLSHDLFEGIYARAGLASDVELVEEAPARYDQVMKRLHRWTRGDWQLLPWILNGRNGSSPVPAVGRWKMIDNLRRSLVAPMTMLACGLTWLLPLPIAAAGTLLIFAAGAVPALIPTLFDLLPRQRRIPLSRHLLNVASDLRNAVLQLVMQWSFIPDAAWTMADAIIRACYRMIRSHRKMLEWTPWAGSGAASAVDLVGSYRRMSGGVFLTLALAVAALVLAPTNAPLIIPLTLFWFAGPAIAWWSSRAPRQEPQSRLNASEVQALRLITRRTWRFFETFVTADQNMLPPDNFQEQPKPVIAHRTSPTNIGLYLLSAVTSRELGWIGTQAVLDRLESTFASLDQMQRYRGHFLNWYGTRDLAALLPAYVSSVDSGNLAGHLIALANALESWKDEGENLTWRAGARDHLLLVRQTFSHSCASKNQPLQVALRELDRQLLLRHPPADHLEQLRQLTAEAIGLAGSPQAEIDSGTVPGSVAGMVADTDDHASDRVYWLSALGNAIGEQIDDRQARAEDAEGYQSRLQRVADKAREFAMAMDFRFLVDPERKLLSIGYSFTENQLDGSCYDLLASEARLASLFAIAKGDVPTRHWFRLSRAAVRSGKGAALVSWSGSMFEYLMPSLVMRAAAGTVLEQTNRVIVAHQQAYGQALGIPWGVSESAFNARDREFTYQYSNFGVPGLGLQRGLAQNQVIAPYATGLAAMVDTRGALANYHALERMGAMGKYGFYEALDFTPSRVPEAQKMAIVRSFMAHHQGMTIVAMGNALLEGRIRSWFHREPMIKASELLLQERMPREVALTRPHAEEVKILAGKPSSNLVTQRRFTALPQGAPVTHILSNSRYAVMVTVAGGGYSRWKDIAISRWSEDSTCDDWRSFLRLRDMRSGKIWSAGFQTQGVTALSERRIRALKGKAFNEVIFGEDHAAYIRHDRTLTTTLTILVSGEDDAEVRRMMLSNSGHRIREVELTSYTELVLAPMSTDKAHPAFAKMFVQTRYIPEFNALIATRRPRSPDEQPVWAAQLIVVEGETLGEIEYETDRARFIGNGGSAIRADAIIDRQPLSGTTGTVLDAIFSLRCRVRIAPGKSVRIAYWTLVAASEAELMDLIDKHHDRSAYKRAKTLAWTQAQVQLRHLDINAEHAAEYQRLAAPLLYSDARFRSPSASIIRGAGPQSALWPMSISGDVPIVLLRIEDREDIALVKQLLNAHEYWHLKLLDVDLVIINEHPASYLQELQIAIETAVRSSQSRPRYSAQSGRGNVYTLRADLISHESRMLLLSVAQVVLIARKGNLSAQLSTKDSPPVSLLPQGKLRLPSPADIPLPRGLQFFNGTGGFSAQGDEYSIVLEQGSRPPAPWINVIANPQFGFQVSARGGGYTWAENSRDNQLTPWLNDPVADSGGEAIYLQNLDTGTLWSPTQHPIDDGGRYLTSHGFGYSRFSHQTAEISSELLQMVPLTDPVKISRLTLTNRGDRELVLRVTVYAEWVMGTSRSASASKIITQKDDVTGALMVTNPWGTAFPGRVGFADLDGRQDAFTTDRSEFIGRNGSLSAPLALINGNRLSGLTGAGIDPCTVLQTTFTLAPYQTIELVWLLGQSDCAEHARQLIERYRAQDLNRLLEQVRQHWQQRLGAIKVKTPDRSMDIMLNGWLLYQTQACRIQARSGFYQASGAYGFRDQLQDGMSLTFSQPDQTRAHLLRAASRQFAEGDVQHWWLPHSGQGVRTRISDDRVWLSYATASYIRVSGDSSVLDEPLAWLEGPQLAPGQHDAFFQPMTSTQTAPLYQHCVQGIEQVIELTGEHGLPLMGTGDWNDGMNRVGEKGKGESVWLGWLLIKTLHDFMPYVLAREPDRAERWQAHAESVRQSIEREAWDGEWYRRATFDDGTWLGSRESDECRIDSIAQSWAVLSGAAEPERARMAMDSMESMLIQRAEKLALLFSPPFDQTPHDPGYIKGYPPGLRENGGQYTHAAMWVILAFAGLKEGNKAHEMFSLLNPVNHALKASDVMVYKVEPYVIAADVYSVEPHAGRGGWTWYTGSAGWMYRAGIEGILGIRREGERLIIEPCLPLEWPGYEADIQVRDTLVTLVVARSTDDPDAKTGAWLDDNPMDMQGNRTEMVLAGGSHRLNIVL